MALPKLLVEPHAATVGALSPTSLALSDFPPKVIFGVANLLDDAIDMR
jgi:hypothetical protein